MTDPNALIRLLHLVSPSLPTGAYSYSQGLEWAVEAGWISDETSLEDWLACLARQSLGRVDIPLLTRMYAAVKDNQPDELKKWCLLLLACRETSELREEEKTRGKAMATLLQRLNLPGIDRFNNSLQSSQLAGFAFAAAGWNIPLTDASSGYIWAWLENQVLTGMKIIPLGQSSGQQLLVKLTEPIPQIVKHGLQLGDEEIGASSPALALAGSHHETQYTRLYRS
ncbi:MAG TPA: urease accessory protein UreF [Desulfocapsa sulfexigens]|nr:urease accessory protein UreF [Desulfocapsa sulfexigens]